MTVTRWHYAGDVNIEYGGMFYRLATFDDDYVDCVRVQPCADAGGPDNCWWIEQLTVSIHEPDAPITAFAGVGATVAERNAHRMLHDMPIPERMENVLASSGWDCELAAWDKLTTMQRRHAIVEACVSYGHYDTNETEVVQIGPSQENPSAHRIDKIAVDKTLRANASLRNYARSKCT